MPHITGEVLVSVVALLIIPALVMLVRITMKWQRIEDRLADITEDLTKVVNDKAEAHKQLYDQMRQDRQATNQRLRWLEENYWRGMRR